jgi:predicted N-formylglutamate amidohydrolase
MQVSASLSRCRETGLLHCTMATLSGLNGSLKSFDSTKHFMEPGCDRELLDALAVEPRPECSRRCKEADDLNIALGGSSPAVSEATLISGNIGLDAAEAKRRRERWFEPFHDAVAAHLNARIGQPTAVVGIHTFTPVFHNAERPWHAGVLFSRAEEFGLALALAIEARCAGLVGRNEPYRIEIDEDYTVPVHGDARGLAAALIEVRQDLVSNVFNIERWSRLLASALASVTHLVGAGES